MKAKYKFKTSSTMDEVLNLVHIYKSYQALPYIKILATEM